MFPNQSNEIWRKMLSHDAKYVRLSQSKSSCPFINYLAMIFFQQNTLQGVKFNLWYLASNNVSDSWHFWTHEVPFYALHILIKPTPILLRIITIMIIINTFTRSEQIITNLKLNRFLACMNQCSLALGKL